MRRVQHIMGMPIIIDIPNTTDEAVFKQAFRLFKQIDKRFSPYKKDSELNRFNRGEIDQEQLSPEMQSIIKACHTVEKATDGYFSAWYQGQFEPSGYVKGWAINRVGNLLKKQGHQTFCISAGGDIWAASDGRKIWRIGLQDPANKSLVLNTLSISSGAVATSGSYERGDHIINPKTAKPARELLSLTVVGPDIIKADVLATAAFAMGKKGADFVTSHPGYQVYVYPGK